MDKLKILVVDDEHATRRLISGIIRSLDFPFEIEINDSSDSVISAMEEIKTFHPDILLLDIQLSDGTGFDLLDLLGNPSFDVIFITAHESYAIQAIKNAAIDYLLKPIDSDELKKAVFKAYRKIYQNQKVTLPVSNEKLVLKNTDFSHVVNLSEIIRCESDKNYTTFYLTDGRKLLVAKTIKEFEEQLCEPNFFRCHRSHIINLNFIDKYDKNIDLIVTMKDRSEVPVSRVNRKDFLKKFEA